VSSIIIDTDIGTNADDAIAIALAIKSNEISIEGITTVYGDVKIRAAIADRIVRLSGNKNIDIYEGIEKPLLRNKEVFWTGIEGKGIKLENNGSVKDKHAVQFIIEKIMNNPGKITLVTIGPLTNVATAILLEPKIIHNIKEIIMMGGVTRLGSNGIDLEPYEHNVSCDPEAASIVFDSGINITMVGLDVTRQLFISRSENKEIFSCKNPLSKTLTTMMCNHMEFLERDYGYLSDPITVSLLINRDIVKTRKMKILIKYDYQQKVSYSIGIPSEKGNVSVVLEIDKNKFFHILYERVFQIKENK